MILTKKKDKIISSYQSLEERLKARGASVDPLCPLVCLEVHLHQASISLHHLASPPRGSANHNELNL